MSTAPRAPFRPSSRRGQNFLVDRAVQRRIASAAALPPGATVVEIGAGTGNLTEALLAHGLRVTAVEIEETLVARLRDRFRNRDHVQIVSGDARRLDLHKLAGGPFHVVANLPYSVGTRLVVSFVTAAKPPRSLTVLLQREVARRLTARLGDMALLSVIVQSYARTRRVFDVPPEAFRPRPKVVSTLVRIDPVRLSETDIASAEARIAVARHAFAQTRKKLRNSLAAGLGRREPEVGAALEAAGIDPGRRPQTLALSEWDQVVAALEVTQPTEPPGGGAA
ncbi:MAG: ribosomal RNA small subunit methyltransferase A [Chloroflexi bacterium]|nr:ribosomal RNA small subunit methyltransferase A [Chloroflexota bacterium]